MVPSSWPWIKVIAKIMRGLWLLPILLCTGAQQSRGASAWFPVLQWDTVCHPVCFLLAAWGVHQALLLEWWPRWEEGGWRATDSDSLAVLAHRTTSRACSIECLHLSVLWIAIILLMEKRHIPKLGRGWEPYSSMLALALLCSTWKGSKSWSNGPGSWADRRQRCTSCFFLNREPAISFASETVQSPSHKAFSKIATGMSGAWRGACDAGFWKWWDGWALRRDTVLEVNRGSNVLLCTPASNNLFSCWMLHFSIIKTLICRVLGHGQILPRTNC